WRIEAFPTQVEYLLRLSRGGIDRTRGGGAQRLLGDQPRPGGERLVVEGVGGGLAGLLQRGLDALSVRKGEVLARTGVALSLQRTGLALALGQEDLLLGALLLDQCLVLHINKRAEL